jgi:iron complex transport system substrate-binding protein
MDPIYNCGHWIPYQISQAGGVDMLSSIGCYIGNVFCSKRFWLWHLVVLKSAVQQEIEALTKLEGWETLKAVQNNAVFLADADLQPSNRCRRKNCWQHYFILIF